MRPLPGFCHLEGRDQPFETQLQTAWVSFGKQLRITFVGPRRIAHDGTSDSPLFRKEPTEPWTPTFRGTSETSSRSRAALSYGAARFCSFLRRPAAWKLATAPERTETAGAFQHVVNSFHSSSPATQAKGCVWADAGSRLHRETHIALFAQARLALDPVPINLSCHGSV